MAGSMKSLVGFLLAAPSQPMDSSSSSRSYYAHGVTTTLHSHETSIAAASFEPSPVMPFNSSTTQTHVSPEKADSWQECQSDKVAYYESWLNQWLTYTSYTVEPYVTSNCETIYPIITDPPYTTVDGYQHAKGSYTTAFSCSPTTYTQEVDRPNITSPTCTIPASQCSILWQSYLRSHGVTVSDLATVAEPPVVPVPSDRPRCSFGEISSSCSTYSAKASCNIYANDVEMFYWPEHGVTANPGTPVVTTHGSNTLTSPSVYISFKSLEGVFWVTSSCTFYTPLGASILPSWGHHGDPGYPPDSTGIEASTSRMSVSNGNVLTFKPEQVSSLIVALNGDGEEYTSSVISCIVRWGVYQCQNYFNTGYQTRPITWSQLNQPPADAYFLGEFSPVLSPCSSCTTIFDDNYKPFLAIPDGWSANFPPEWKTCNAIGLVGLYDPPSALTGYSEVPPATLPYDTHRTTDPATARFTTTAQPGVPPIPALIPTSTPTLTTSTASSPSIPDSSQESNTAAQSASKIATKSESTAEPNPVAANTYTLNASPFLAFTLHSTTYTAYALNDLGTISVANTILSLAGPAATVNGQVMSLDTGGLMIFPSPSVTGGSTVGSDEGLPTTVVPFTYPRESTAGSSTGTRKYSGDSSSVSGQENSPGVAKSSWIVSASGRWVGGPSSTLSTPSGNGAGAEHVEKKMMMAVLGFVLALLVGV